MNSNFLSSIAAVAALLSVGCAGTHSTIKEGFAFRMKREAARDVVQGAMAAHVLGGRIESASDLSASGYMRILLDTHDFHASAIPLPRADAYGFELSHSGTIPIQGSAKARRIYAAMIERASAAGERVSTR